MTALRGEGSESIVYNRMEPKLPFDVKTHVISEPWSVVDLRDHDMASDSSEAYANNSCRKKVSAIIQMPSCFSLGDASVHELKIWPKVT